jgi:hypothetical protein
MFMVDLKAMRDEVYDRLSSLEEDFICFFYWYDKKALSVIDNRADRDRQFMDFVMDDFHKSDFQRVIQLKESLFYKIDIASFMQGEMGSPDPLGMALGVSCGDFAYFTYTKISKGQFKKLVKAGVNIKTLQGAEEKGDTIIVPPEPIVSRAPAPAPAPVPPRAPAPAPPTFNAWVMVPDQKPILRMNLSNDPTPAWIKLYFPNGFETMTTQHKTGLNDYYCLFFDAETKWAKLCDSAVWICKFFPDIPPTGNFVILHKLWHVEEEFESNEPIEIDVKAMQNLFRP